MSKKLRRLLEVCTVIVMIGVLSIPLIIAVNNSNELSDEFPIGTEVSIKGFNECNCTVKGNDPSKVFLLCNTHTGIDEIYVKPEMITKCEKDFQGMKVSDYKSEGGFNYLEDAVDAFGNN